MSAIIHGEVMMASGISQGTVRMNKPDHRILVLGGSGMLGHMLARTASRNFNTFITLRERLSTHGDRLSAFEGSCVENVSARDFDSVVRAVAITKPTVVVNCIGIVKQLAGADSSIESISINSLFPHRVASLCRATGARFIGISTDCVFSGSKGNYSEMDTPDAEDLYGRSKLLGEVVGDNELTIRTSIIGRQLKGSYGLLEWFINQNGKQVEGYKRVIFSGLTTEALSEIILTIVEKHPDLSGLWHLASKPINKFDLLSLIREAGSLDIDIKEDHSRILDRSLDGERLRKPPESRFQRGRR
ncbi:MAG: SDR family oxidoreductase [Candidatus Melainabacteria bacterium]|nr:SDR family oxidoreductase [Candidatus Melainabacteria bacterium]